MRTAIAALALALSSSLAAADPQLYIVRAPIKSANADERPRNLWLQSLKGILDQVAPGNYRVVDASATRTGFIRSGVQFWNFSPATGSYSYSSTFSAALIEGMECSINWPFGSSLDSLMRAGQTGGWPAIPIAFVGLPGCGANKWTNSASCSSGVTAINLGQYSSLRQANTLYQPGSNAYWKSPGVTLQPNVRSGYSGTWRALVASAYSAANRSGAMAADRLLVSWPDSSARSWAPDTVGAWAHYRTGNPANPQSFWDVGCSPPPDVGQMLAIVAFLDSASGNKIVTRPARFAAIVRHAAGLSANGENSTGEPSGGIGGEDGGGILCNSGTCDSLNQQVAAETLKVITQRTGARLTFYVDPDSARARPWMLAWWLKIPNAHFGIEAYGGTYLGAALASTATSCVDPFGHVRYRTILPAGATGLPTSCVTDTGSIYCAVTHGRVTLESLTGASRVDHSIYPAFSDWSPAYVTAAKMAGAGGGSWRDSVAWALHMAGVRAIVVKPEWVNTAPGVSWVYVAGDNYLSGATGPGLNPAGFGAFGRVPVYRQPGVAGGEQISSIAMIGTRGHKSPNTNVGWNGTGHDTKDEGFLGAATGVWHHDKFPYYYHTFETGTPIVIEVNAGELGGTGPGATPGRSGLWNLVWFFNQLDAANRLMAPGRKIAIADWVENLSPRSPSAMAAP
jgi:hypothetical protein